jgi:hypothetical protein
LGTGGEDAREFGQATQLRLLSFPANWLAIAGLVGWLMLGFRQGEQATGDRRQATADKETADKETRAQGDKQATVMSRSFVLRPSSFVFYTHYLSLEIWILLYVLAISVGLAPQARFFLPLAPIYALAAAWAITRIQPGRDAQPAAIGESAANTAREEWSLAGWVPYTFPLIAGIVLLALLWGGFAGGAAYVTRVRTPADDNAPGQPADEAAAARLVLQTLRADERLVLQPPQGSLDGLSLGKYSAIADRVAPTPASDDLADLRSTGAGYLLRATTLGPPPGGLIPVASAGGYTLYILPR